MEEWLAIVLRQLILYSLPVLISLTLLAAAEASFSRKSLPHPFYAVSGWTAWLPLLASICFHRGMIVALPRHLTADLASACIRFGMHLMLGLAGALLYSWSLQHPPATGLPPLHHWWAKVLMFFNLCMATMHLLPLPGFIAGEFVRRRLPTLMQPLSTEKTSLLLALLAATPILDWLLGGLIVFPVYEWLSHLAR